MTASVLVVDDSLTVRMNLCDALIDAGLLAVAVGSIADARAALAREAFSVVILDVMLPDGDGIDFLGELRATLATTPVMLLSSEIDVRDRIRGISRGADDYVGKPYDIGYVVSRTKELARRSTGTEIVRRATVLIIDDSATFREALGSALVEAGYEVVMAATGEDGLKIAADKRPTAIIVDGVLPGIHGRTVVRRIRLDAALRGTPCLLLTGSDGADAELRALDAGADAFARKEQDSAIVLARVAAMIRSASGRQSEDMESLSGPKKILAVDDSRTYLNEIGDALRTSGYEVAFASCGEEALDLLAAQPVDCVLLDLMMPGMGGQETCRRIKSAPSIRDTPLIMLTALDDRDAVVRGLSAGADDFIAKSSDIEVLKARILAQIRRKQFEDENRSIRERLLMKEREATEARAAHKLSETRAALAAELARKNKELEAFSYSVSHDLRAPLRSIEGFSKAILDDFGGDLHETARGHFDRVRAATRRMEELIDDLLQLSQVNRGDLRRGPCSLSEISKSISEDLAQRDPARNVTFSIHDGLVVDGDPGLLRAVLENLLGNAWKFTAKVAAARIEVSVEEHEADRVYFVRDNGAGFDPAHADRLFAPFQRLHATSDFPGTGIGLATVYRIVDRHGGRVWAEGAVGKGATIYFTLTSSRLS
jgi:two-component system, NtrC family, sensor kinase